MDEDAILLGAELMAVVKCIVKGLAIPPPSAWWT